ncbi:MAG TPA: AFG1/ZapE family ATPase, partial [Burkholderiales bacterium]|nr:AFG1/ZapE family ATPase [Burkholderiales bacterium]
MPQAIARSTQPKPFRAFAESRAQAHGYRLDRAQLRAVTALERLYRELQSGQGGALRLLRLFRRPRAVRGAYLWGGVGRGKSFLMDVFFEAAPVRHKQ